MRAALKADRIIIASIVVVIMAMAHASAAAAHTLRPADCRSYATAFTGSHGPATISRWRRELRSCTVYASRHNAKHLCERPALPLISRATVKHRAANLHQRQVLTRILNVGRKMRAPSPVMVGAIAATTQEASATNLGHGTGTSVGILQLIDTHGSFRWRMVIENSAGWFFRGAEKVAWHRTDPAGIAQAVERSGHPTAYRPWVSEARRTYQAYLGPCRR